MSTRQRLDSWKAIAAYLDRDVRTVQRWHVTAGLPVHRVADSRVRSVFAFADDLDTWLQAGPPVDPPATGGINSTRPHGTRAFVLIATPLVVAGGVILASMAGTGPMREGHDTAARLAAAQTLAGRGDWPAAVRVMEATAEDDPDDPLVLAWLAITSVNAAGTSTRVATLVERARAHRRDGTDETRSFVDTVAVALLEKAPGRAIDAFNAHLARYPRDIWSRRFLANKLLQHGRQLESAKQDALIAKLAPRDFTAQAQAAVSLATWAGDIDAARPYVARARPLLSDDPAEQRPLHVAFVVMFPAYDAWQRGDAISAAVAVDEGWSRIFKRSPATRDAGATMAASLQLSLGRLRKARAIVETLQGPHQRHAELARLAEVQGQIGEMRRLLELVPPSSMRAGLWQYAVAGLESSAREAFDHARHAIPAPAQGDLDLLLALATQQDEQAALLATAAHPELFSTDTESLLADVRLEQLIAGALLRLGRHDEAIRLLERATHAVPGFNPYGVDGLSWIEARLTLRDAYLAAGQRDRAARLTADAARRLALADAGLQVRQRLTPPTDPGS